MACQSAFLGSSGMAHSGPSLSESKPVSNRKCDGDADSRLSRQAFATLSERRFSEMCVRVGFCIPDIVEAEALESIEPKAIANHCYKKKSRSDVEHVATDGEILEPV